MMPKAIAKYQGKRAVLCNAKKDAEKAYEELTK